MQTNKNNIDAAPTNQFRRAQHLIKSGKYPDAKAILNNLLNINFDPDKVLHSLANIEHSLGNYASAFDLYEKSLYINRSSPETLCDLGTLYMALNNPRDAIHLFKEALSYKPDFPEALYNLALCMTAADEYQVSNNCLRLALKYNPEFIEAKSLLAFQMKKVCEWDHLAEIENEVLSRIEKNDSHALPPFHILTYHSTPHQQLNSAKKWAQQIENKVSSYSPFFKHSFDHSNEKIRIGYLSSDIHQHATAYLFSELLELHARDKFEIYVYSYGHDDNSDIRKRIIAESDVFVDMGDYTFYDSAKRIYQDQIDILIDLKGYTQNARTEILALKPAPIQINWLGYPGTMGANFIDYIIADNFIIPESANHNYSEKILRMPHCYQINDSQRTISKPLDTKEAYGLPNNSLVLCSFNQAYKITPEIFKVWMKILDQFQNTVIWLLESDPTAVQNLKNEALKNKISPDRLVFAQTTTLRDHLARYKIADLCLDTFPVNSHTTASDALWSGCPIITIKGKSFISRVCSSLLENINLPELITNNLVEYESKIKYLLNNQEQLSLIKQRLEENIHTTPLFDSKQFTHDLESLFFKIYEKEK